MSLPDNPSSLAARLRPLGFTRYKDYLASDHWKNVKRRHRQSGLPQKCRCGRRANALHHTTYVRLGREVLADLEPVCNSCHAKLHGKRKRRTKAERQELRGLRRAHAKLDAAFDLAVERDPS